ncbi:MAG: M48 family metalloprotease [Pseudanabaena sp. CRU_2_10]|nr:M48 family metalloprotease [Pseudanabaena sp. CRU_2_10]
MFEVTAVTQWHKSLLRAIWKSLQRYQRLFVASFLTTLLAINLNPSIAEALDWTDLFRVVPSVIQVVQLSNISDSQEVELGRQLDRKIGSEVKISRDPAAIDLVRSIGAQLVPNSDRPNMPYTFQVVDDKNINAFATMGGFVYVNTGTIAQADNRAQLAAVIAHEMGHISGRHALEQIRQMALAQGLASVAGLDKDQFVNIGVQLALRLPNSREAEFDADRRGLSTISRSGYAPQAMPAFMQKLVSKSGGVPGFLSTHPGADERIVALNDRIERNNLSGQGGLNDRKYQRQWRNRFR